MNPAEFQSDTPGFVHSLFACSECRIIKGAGEAGYEAALGCCKPFVCGICGGGAPKYSTKCESCREARGVAVRASWPRVTWGE